MSCQLGHTGKQLGTAKAADAEDSLERAVEEFGINPQDVSRTLVRESGWSRALGAKPGSTSEPA